jgi:hypothetical protein
MNIVAKHEGQATVASRDWQNWHSGASVELAAPQLGQLSVSACIFRILAGERKRWTKELRCAILKRNWTFKEQ